MPRRVVITNREKIAFLDEIDRQERLGESLRRAICRALNIQPSQAPKWKQLCVRLADPHVGHRGSLHGGRHSTLEPFQNDILTWFSALRAEGVMVSTRLLVIKASQLDGDFRRKTPRAKELAMRRLLASNHIITRCVTHTCQHPPNAVRQEALDFIHYMRDKVVGGNRDLNYIINMDQTPVFFDMSTGRTLNQAGNKQTTCAVSCYKS
jgi:hypothetical protein